jgi:hypothetical protein
MSTQKERIDYFFNSLDFYLRHKKITPGKALKYTVEDYAIVFDQAIEEENNNNETRQV